MLTSIIVHFPPDFSSTGRLHRRGEAMAGGCVGRANLATKWQRNALNELDKRHGMGENGPGNVTFGRGSDTSDTLQTYWTVPGQLLSRVSLVRTQHGSQIGGFARGGAPFAVPGPAARATVLPQRCSGRPAKGLCDLARGV